MSNAACHADANCGHGRVWAWSEHCAAQLVTAVTTVGQEFNQTPAVQIALLLLELAMSLCWHKHEDWLPVLSPCVASGPGQLVALPPFLIIDATPQPRAPPLCGAGQGFR